MAIRNFISSNLIGIHYAVRILVGIIILLLITRAIHATSPLWAIISLIIVSEPHPRVAWMTFRSRMINTLMGSLVGFSVLVYAGTSDITLICAITFTAFLSTYLNKVQQGWRIAPITTALVISAGMAQQSAAIGMEYALSRTFEVFLGSAVALIVTLAMARIWAPAEHAGEAERKQA